MPGDIDFELAANTINGTFGGFGGDFDCNC
jgi:hypothetical protein